MPTKQIAWNDGSGDSITLTYQGQSDGAISAVSDPNNGAARSQVITIQTTQGGLVTKNVTVNQAACTFPIGDVKNYSYTGSYQEVELPAGQYKLQCWGAQGGSNAVAPSYGITAKAGGKGGYSEGILTLTSKTTVRIYVGGAGTSSAGGFNGGGSTSGSASYNSGNEQGVSRMGGGGGATDIRLSDGALLSRMIVAGGGSGGAMCYQKVTTSTTTIETKSIWPGALGFSDYGINNSTGEIDTDSNPNFRQHSNFIDIKDFVKIKADSFNQVVSGGTIKIAFYYYNSSQGYISATNWYTTTSEITPPSNARYIRIVAAPNPDNGFWINWDNRLESPLSLTLYYTKTTSTTTTNNYGSTGYAGGGTTGAGYSSTYQGKQNAAGGGGSFGQGANQTATNYRYCGGGGGGGWYGGGGGVYSDSTTGYTRQSGGGSGFVNTAASAGNRPSGYTGLELDSGETKAGDTSFPSPSGGTETGHSGNGYVRITRLS